MLSGTYCFSLDYDIFITIRTNRKGTRLFNNILWYHCNIERDKIEHRPWVRSTWRSAMEIERVIRQTSPFLYLRYIIYLYMGTLFIIYGIQLSVDKINNLSQYFKHIASVSTWTFINHSKRDEKLKRIKSHYFFISLMIQY